MGFWELIALALGVGYALKVDGEKNTSKPEEVQQPKVAPSIKDYYISFIQGKLHRGDIWFTHPQYNPDGEYTGDEKVCYLSSQSIEIFEENRDRPYELYECPVGAYELDRIYEECAEEVRKEEEMANLHWDLGEGIDRKKWEGDLHFFLDKIYNTSYYKKEVYDVLPYWLQKDIDNLLFSYDQEVFRYNKEYVY